MTDITYAQVWADHVIAVGEPGESVAVKVLSGDTVYYGDPNVSSTTNRGSITAGNSATMTNPVSWLRSASASFVSITGDVTGGGGGVQIGGDLTGSAASPVVSTVNGGQTPVNIATFLGSSQVVRPSGDATGAADATNINAALASAATSVYLNGNYTINATLSIPSNTTLILADASITLHAAANVAMIANPSYTSSSTPGASNLHIRGIGRAILDYNGSNQTEQAAALWNSCCITLVNVSNYSIEGIQFQNSQYLWILQQACSVGRVRDIHGVVGATDKGLIHTDIGCSNISIDGVRSSGTWSDSVFSFNSVSIATAGPTTPYAATLVGAARNITQVSVSNVTVASSTGLLCFFVDASGNISDFDFANIHNTYTGAAVGEEMQFGPAGTAAVTLSGQASITGIRVKGYTFGGTNHWLLTLDNACTDIQISNVRANGTVKGLLGNFAAVPATYIPQAARIKFSDVDLPATGASTAALASLVSGWKADDIAFENVRIGVLNGPLVKNVSDVTGLKVSNVHVGTLGANPFQSTGNEVGVVENFTYDYRNTGVSKILPVTATLRIGQPFPTLSPGETSPAPVRGSEIHCAPGMDPTGGAATAGGKYIADGIAWNLQSSFNTTFKPDQMPYPLLFHHDAANIRGVTNGNPVAVWPDTANNNALVQATGANQPTFTASDTHLNSHPSVVFNGTSSFMQNLALTPIVNAQPFSLFIVYYSVTSTAGRYILNAATLGSATDGPTYYQKATTNTGGFLGTTSVQNASAYALNTCLIACMTAGAVANQVNFGENRAAFASMTNGSSGSRTITGLTLAAAHDGASLWSNIAVAEVFGYGALISSADYAAIMAALATKYGVTLT